jgi:hypothetical protein
MASDGSDLVDIVLFILAGGAVAVLACGFLIGAAEACARWRDDRRIRKHLHN